MKIDIFTVSKKIKPKIYTYLVKQYQKSDHFIWEWQDSWHFYSIRNNQKPKKLWLHSLTEFRTLAFNFQMTGQLAFFTAHENKKKTSHA